MWINGKLQNVESIWDGKERCELVEEPSCRLSEDKVMAALKCSKTGKGLGPSEAVRDMTTGVEWLTNMCNLIVTEVRIPGDLNSRTMSLGEGKGGSLECGSFGIINLLEEPLKIV